jgi:4'-phosphopantetheinyl transferase
MKHSQSWEGVLAMFLSDYENRWVSELVPAHKWEMAYRLWTIKEAYLKATGTGLTVSPTAVEVRLTGDGCYKFYRLHGAFDSIANWTIVPFTPDARFSGSVVVDSGPVEVESFVWEADRLHRRP